MQKPVPTARERYGVDEVVDAQVHIWPANTPETPWPKNALSPPQKPYPVSAETMLLQMDLSAIGRAVIVPPSWAGDSNACALDAAQRYPERFAVMGRYDIFSAPDRQRILDWRKTPGMLGIRLFIFSKQECEQLESGRLAWLFDAAQEAGVPMYMMVPVLPDAAGTLEGILQRHPGLKLALDHMNMLPQYPQNLTQGLPKLMPLARYPNFALKASCLPNMSERDYPYEDLHAPLKMCFDHFGPKRLFWGTDLTRSRCTYVENAQLFTEHLPWLKGEDLAWVMGRGLRAWLGW